MGKLGLLGEKLGHSYSKEIHEIFFKIAQKKANYNLIERKINEIPDLIMELKVGKYKGINVTIPYKVEVMKYLDEVTSVAKNIGAVNTVTVKDGKLIGDNTDYSGFLKTLELNKIEVEGKKILMLGTGGAAKAVYSVLKDGKAGNIYIATISANDPFPLKKPDRLIYYSEIKNIRSVDIIVNCTPVGMYPEINMSPLEGSNMVHAENVIDIIYNPRETVLMKKYREKGAKVVNGLMMLVAQALKSEEIWHDEEYGEEILIEIYEKLSEKLYK